MGGYSIADALAHRSGDGSDGPGPRPTKRRRNLFAVILAVLLVADAGVYFAVRHFSGDVHDNSVDAADDLLPLNRVSGPDVLVSETTNAVIAIPRTSLSAEGGSLEAKPVDVDESLAFQFGEAVSVLDDGVDVTLTDAHLTGPAQIRFRLPDEFDASRFTPAVIWADADGTLQIQRSSWAPGDPEVLAELEHFSWGFPVKIDWSIMADSFTSWLGGLATGRAGAAPPSCGDEQVVRKTVSITSDTGDLVMWCFGRQDGKDILKVTNNWRAGIQVTFPKKWDVVSYEGAGFQLQAIGDWLDSASRETRTTHSRLVGQGQTIVLEPHDLAEGARATVEQSTVSWLWSIALQGLSLYMTVVGKLAGLDHNVKAEDLLDGADFINCFTEYYGTDIAEAVRPVESGSTFSTVAKAIKFGLSCGADVLKESLSGEGGISRAVARRVVGIVVAAIGIVYELINASSAGMRSLIDQIGELFDRSEVGGYGYDILFSPVASAPVDDPSRAQPTTTPTQPVNSATPASAVEEIYEVGPINLDTTCLEYLGYTDDERGAAVRVLGVQAGWQEAGHPFSILNFDAHCSQRPKQTMRQALGLFAD